MPTLLTNSIQLQQFVEVGDGLSWTSIAPSVFVAENNYLASWMGLKLYKHLTANESVAEYQDLLEYARSASAKFALWLYSAKGGNQITDMGIYQAKTSDIWRLSEAELADLRKAFLADAMDALNLLIEYLEENAAAPAEGTLEAAYTAFQWWYVSTVRKQLTGLLIKSADVFSNYVELYRSSLTYWMLSGAMAQVERQMIAPMLGVYYATLKAMTAPTGNDAVLLALAQEALAKLSAGIAMQRGLHIMENARLSFSINPHQPDETLLRAYLSEGERALQRLRAALESLRPAGYVPLSSVSDVLRKEGSKIILA